ncbi:hypothetical protein LshimejAT787_0703940 [Lyophyllum shimeji]|uniref:Uncharacterized protein n=1 Tax=Lyophyllum shimeji TaxID=47721 RepID=A0A9P3PQV3_LYOSH|nr:hypothetical protein LshimejAT787_0703940 [Lyophyllum shimeji]
MRALGPFPDIVTYRLGSKLVWVRPAQSYQEAIDFAQKAFPLELADVSPHRITFSIAGEEDGERYTTYISESAWVSVMRMLMQGEVIDLDVDPLVRTRYLKRWRTPAPRYNETGPTTALRFGGTYAPSSGSR